MKTLFKNNYERKRWRCDKTTHKATRIPVDINQTNKKFYVTVQPKNVCKLEFADHLWLPFLDQIQSGIVVFSIINFYIYNIIMGRW